MNGQVCKLCIFSQSIIFFIRFVIVKPQLHNYDISSCKQIMELQFIWIQNC